jgi:hypothetical protein
VYQFTTAADSLEMFREVAKLLVREHALPDDLIGDLYPFEDRSDAGVCAYIDQAEYAQIQMIVLDLLMGDFLSVEHWELDRLEDNYGVGTLRALAKLEGLDPTKDYRQPDTSPATIGAEYQADEVTASKPVVPAVQNSEAPARPVLKLKVKADTPAQETTGPTIKVKKHRTLSLSQSGVVAELTKGQE